MSYAKFDKYVKPKIFMPTTSNKCQISKFWQKNMPVGNTDDNPRSETEMSTDQDWIGLQFLNWRNKTGSD